MARHKNAFDIGDVTFDRDLTQSETALFAVALAEARETSLTRDPHAGFQTYATNALREFERITGVHGRVAPSRT